jgi:hypothetical protein
MRHDDIDSPRHAPERPEGAAGSACPPERRDIVDLRHPRRAQRDHLRVMPRVQQRGDEVDREGLRPATRVARDDVECPGRHGPPQPSAVLTHPNHFDLMSLRGRCRFGAAH